MARNTENQKVFKDGCWKQERSPVNSMIFVDLRVSIWNRLQKMSIYKEDLVEGYKFDNSRFSDGYNNLGNIFFRFKVPGLSDFTV